MNLKRFLILLTVLLAGAAVWYFGRPILLKKAAKAEIAKSQKESPTATAAKRDIRHVLQITGDASPIFQVDIKSEISGKVKRLLVEPGQQVKKGELLVEIDDRDLQTEKRSALVDIEGAELSTEKTRRNYERARELFESKLISEEVYQNLEADLKIAENQLVKSKSRLQTVEDRLAKTKIVAPADGTILTTDVLEGSLVVGAQSVNSGTSMMFLANLSKLLVNSHVNQIDVALIKKGQNVKIFNAALGDVEMSASVSYVAPIASVRNNVKGFTLELLIDNPHERLRPGMTVNIEVPVADASDVVSVPVSGIFSENEMGGGSEKVVFVRNSSGGTEKRRVQVGIADLFYAEILDGLQPGEEILLTRPLSTEFPKSANSNANPGKT